MLKHKTFLPILNRETYANNADTDKISLKAEFDHGLHCFLKEYYVI